MAQWELIISYPKREWESEQEENKRGKTDKWKKGRNKGGREREREKEGERERDRGWWYILAEEGTSESNDLVFLFAKCFWIHTLHFCPLLYKNILQHLFYLCIINNTEWSEGPISVAYNTIEALFRKKAYLFLCFKGREQKPLSVFPSFLFSIL